MVVTHFQTGPSWRTRGIRATIVMPVDAPGVKRRAVEGYGAKVIECEPTQDARETAAARIVEGLSRCAQNSTETQSQRAERWH